jgi:hypothetical protein
MTEHTHGGDATRCSPLSLSSLEGPTSEKIPRASMLKRRWAAVFLHSCFAAYARFPLFNLGRSILLAELLSILVF